VNPKGALRTHNILFLQIAGEEHVTKAP
jgi:hypothetical protein